MRVKLFHEPTVSEAMARVRAELGPDALILSTRRVAGGVELTAAMEQAEIPPAACAAADGSAVMASSLPRTSRVAGSAAPAHPGPAAGPAMDPAAFRAAQSELGCLAYHGVPPALAARMAGPNLATALRAALRFGMLPIALEGPPLMLTGMPGAGKTLSIARVATRLVLAGITPLVISADGRRAAAAEELAAYTRLLGAGLIVATTPAMLLRALGQRRAGMPVLIDTPGINPYDPGDIALLRGLVEACGAVPVLAVQAGLDAVEAEDQAAAFAALGARHLLATRLDLARRLGAVLAAAARADLILTEAGVGTGATDGLVPLTADFLAERLRAAAAAAWRSGHPAAAGPGHRAGGGHGAAARPGSDGAAAPTAGVDNAAAVPNDTVPLAPAAPNEWRHLDQTAAAAPAALTGEPDDAPAAADHGDATPSFSAQDKAPATCPGRADNAFAATAEGEAMSPGTTEEDQPVVWASQSGAPAPSSVSPAPFSAVAPPDALRGDQFPRRVTTPWMPRRLTPAERARAIAPASDR